MSIARDLWLAVEPIHSLYLDPVAKPLFKSAGMRGGWMSYFAARSCALGPATAELVESTFYGFSPSLIGRSIPAVWDIADPGEVHEVRLQAVDVAVRETRPHLLGSQEVAKAAALARKVTTTFTLAGRPLYAAHASLPAPDEPHLDLWLQATLIREFRGDAHIAGLLTREVGPVDSLVFHAATGELSRRWLQSMRGWSDEDWDSAEDRLSARGWIVGGGLTTAGREAREELEQNTDRLSLPSRAEGTAEELLHLIGSIW